MDHRYFIHQKFKARHLPKIVKEMKNYPAVNLFKADYF